jgi:transcriptional regulator with XRE-family HTH domain
MTPTLKRLIMRLKQLRATREMSQADLAERSGISREYIARLETGHHDPSVSTLVKLAKALKVKPGKLLE